MNIFKWDEIENFNDRWVYAERYHNWCRENIKPGSVVRLYFPYPGMSSRHLHGELASVVSLDRFHIYNARLESGEIERLHPYEFKPIDALTALAITGV